MIASLLELQLQPLHFRISIKGIVLQQKTKSSSIQLLTNAIMASVLELQLQPLHFKIK
jgi:hypothetical protein